jgi:DNA-binding GntR family transcriptional regulator
MSLAANDPRPKPVKLADAVRQRIKDGKYPDGKIPPTRQLASEFGIATQTVRDGLSLLVNEGLIFSGGNQGFFVTSSVPKDSAPSQSERSIREEIKEIHSTIQALAARVAALEELSRSGGA